MQFSTVARFTSCICFVVLGTIVPQTSAIAQSFDCSKASTRAERAICSDPTLGQLDIDLDQAYAAALTVDPAVRDQQRAWLRVRDSCQGIRGCLASQMKRRLNELRTVSSQRAASGTALVVTGDQDAGGGSELARLQEAMRILGLYDGDVDGLDGPRTQAAIRELIRVYTFARSRMSIGELADVAEAKIARKSVPITTADAIFPKLERPLTEGFWSLNTGAQNGTYRFAPVPGGYALSRSNAARTVTAEFRASRDRNGLVRVGASSSSPTDIPFTTLDYRTNIFGADALKGGRGLFLIRLPERPELAPHGLAELTLRDFCMRFKPLATTTDFEVRAAMRIAGVGRPADLDWPVRTNALRLGLFGPTSVFADIVGTSFVDLPPGARAAVLQRLASCAVWIPSADVGMDIGLAILRPYGRNALAEVYDEIAFTSGSSEPPRLIGGPGAILSAIEEAIRLETTLVGRINQIETSGAAQSEKLRAIRQLGQTVRSKAIPSRVEGQIAKLNDAENRVRRNILVGAEDDDSPRSEQQLVHAATQQWLLSNCGLSTAPAGMDVGEKTVYATSQTLGNRAKDGFCVKNNLTYETRTQVAGVSQVECSGGAEKRCSFLMQRLCKTVNNPDFGTQDSVVPDPVCAIANLPVRVTGQFFAETEQRWQTRVLDW
jgi:uncharacterized protein YecT (DUF1311 family)